MIEAELLNAGAVRVTDSASGQAAGGTESAGLNPNEDFMRMLRLSGLDSDGLTDDQRDAFVNMAEKIWGIDPGDAEDLVDLYLEEIEQKSVAPPPRPPVKGPATPRPLPAVVGCAPVADHPDEVAVEEALANFTDGIGAEMLFVPAGVFRIGSEAHDAPPNEQPITQITLTRYYISRHPITNAQYELFDPSHARKRASGAGDRHPVVYVSSNEAAKFCQWLSSRERQKYRLPSEAEWELCRPRNGQPQVSVGRPGRTRRSGELCRQ